MNTTQRVRLNNAVADVELLQMHTGRLLKHLRWWQEDEERERLGGACCDAQKILGTPVCPVCRKCPACHSVSPCEPKE